MSLIVVDEGDLHIYEISSQQTNKLNLPPIEDIHCSHDICVALGTDHKLHVLEIVDPYNKYDAFIESLPKRIVKIFSSDAHFLVFATESTLYCYTSKFLKQRNCDQGSILQIGIEGKDVVNVTTNHPSRVFVLCGRERYDINSVYSLSDVDCIAII